MLRIRLGRVLASAHGSFFLLSTNRYVFHAILLFISITTITTQLGTKTATAHDTGHHSLLYTMVTNGEDELIQEDARPELLSKNSDYLGPDTIKALAGIDLDYEGDGEEPPLADLTVPGTIAVQPSNQDTGTGSQPVIPQRTKTETYVVEAGDSIATIANKFGINVGTILWANNLGARSLIRPGDNLKIPPVSGVLHVVKRGDTIEKIAQRYGAKTEDVYSANRLTPTHVLALGEELIVPGGVPPAAPVAVAPTRTPVGIRTNIPVTTIRNKSFDKYQELQTGTTDLRTKPPDVDVVNLAEHKLLWPTRLHVINQYYGWRHTGVDIDGDYTDPIYAADDGVVQKAGWNSGGYGLMILIDHQDGYVTRYGHASKLFVQPGDQVKRGQVIAMIGTTGRSTGTHLHFEVYTNGRRVNPLAYIR